MRIPPRLASSIRPLLLCGGAAAFLLATPALAAIPADYKGMPFDPMVEGGVGIIPTTVKAGPYAIPGRIDFVNYDMGGSDITFHAGDHITTKSGAGYRKGGDVATFSKTSVASKDVWYDSGTAMDGMTYPDATTQDFYVGAVQVNDWFDFTVDVKTAGTYSVSSTWSSGNGPPGGEGGDGSMGLQIYSNGTKLADWKSSFPDFQNKASFHFWKPYPSFATVTLPAGLQVLKLQSTSKHLNLDYVQFDLMGADGGTSTGAGGSTDAGSTGAGGASGAAGATAGAAGATGTGGATAGTAGAMGGAGSTGTAGDGAAGSTSAGSAGSTGSAGVGTAGAGTAGVTGGGSAGATGSGGTAPKHASGGGCVFAGSSSPSGGSLAAGAAIVLGLLMRARRRRR
jgi:hypothetical protein